MGRASLEIWEKRLGRAAALLGDRLDNPPSLTELAVAASVSPFHLHRIWRAMTGETVGQSIARLRMDAAKEALVEQSDITQVAMATGFSTPQSFARAFRKQTGQTPSEWRSRGGAAPSAVLPGPVEVVRRDATTVVALRSVGHAYVELNATFQAVWDWADAADLLGGMKGLYGIALDDPGSLPEEDLRFDAALALGDVTAPEPFHVVKLGEGQHLQLVHKGSYDHLEASTQRLFEWLLASDLEPADAPVFYHYLNDPEATPEDELETQILLRLETSR